MILKRMKQCNLWIHDNESILKNVPQLLTRLTLGLLFFRTGWGKLAHLDKTIDYFSSLGIPAAHIQAPFAATTEFLCGGLLLIGLGTRLATIPLSIIMLVAIRTAKWEDITSWLDLFGVSEFLYLLLLIWLEAAGAGSVSIDRWIRTKLLNKK